MQLNEDKMKIHWDHVKQSIGSFSDHVDKCKDTDYDTDGGFWDSIGDFFWGEDFDYSSVNLAIINFYNCIHKKLQGEAAIQFSAKFNAQCKN